MTPRRTPGSAAEPGADSPATDGPGVRRPRVTKAAVGLLAVGALVGTLVAVTAVQAISSTGGEGCTSSAAPLRIVAVPEVAEVLGRLAQLNTARDRECPVPISIKAVDAATTARGLRTSAVERPDVWIPDSSVWTTRAKPTGGNAADAVPQDNPSVARSPIVIAVSEKVARDLHPDGKKLSVDDLVPSSAAATGPARWVLTDPDQSAGAIGALLGLRSSVADRADATTVVGAVIRSADGQLVGLPEVGTSTTAFAVPVSEQQLFVHNTEQPGAGLVAAYPRSAQFAFDYPYVTLTTDLARRAEAADLLASLQSDVGQRMLAGVGFRSAAGVAGDALAAGAGVDSGQPSAAQVPDEKAVDSAVTAYRRVIRPSRLLALIDVSGSMGTPVPGTRGATRLDLAVQASLSGLAVYPDDASVGLWVFATHLTAKTDYRQLAPLSPLTRGSDGVSGRERMVRGLAQVKVEKGRTGMYDSVLAAVREVRRTWDPQRANSVVLITDGADTDPQSIGRDGLITQLRKENDPAKPVAVFAIAYGPTGDLPTLSKISDATGGRAYAAPDPRMISRVMADAIGRRACEPDC